MKDRLLNLISRVINLLTDCGWQDKAMWFDEIRTILECKSTEAEKFQHNLDRLDKALAGMGSFSDIPLTSKNGKLSDQELRDIQWELVAELGEVINKLRIS